MTRRSSHEKYTRTELFTPAQLGRYLLPSRIIMSPMTRNRADRDGVPTPIMATYYSQRATAAMIITEAAPVSAQAVGYPHTPGIYSAEQIEGWKKVVTAVHAEGGRIFLQLFHAGRISHPSLQPHGVLPIAPSAIAPKGEALTYEGHHPFVTPHALQRTEIAEIVDQFSVAALSARVAGFDGVEIHAANGYLLDQFLRDGSNRRIDEYGGTITNRLRFLQEVTAAVLTAWGADRVGVRLSPLNSFNSMRDSNPESTFRAAVETLNGFPLAYLHLVEEDRSPASGPRFDVSRLRAVWKGTLIVNGGYDLERAENALRTSRADFISFGRLFIANPDLPARLRTGAPLNHPDRASFYGGDELGYIDYPRLADSIEESSNQGSA
jgi:N-ethylmaleimide reductase